MRAGHNRLIVTRPLWICLALCLLPALPAAASTDHIDGISDQDLPAWDGSFQDSPLADLLRDSLAGSPGARITIARYVMQWNVAGEPSAGPSATGDYRERFEAWLADVGAIGLTPVLAPTSYNGVYPDSPGAYARALAGVLAIARATGHPVADVEPWNEPNGQGRLAPAVAASLANVADSLCAAAGCQVIAGDLQDSAGAVAYERAYERGLRFTPAAWGVHPYIAVADHDDATLLSLEAQLPDHGGGAQLWITEVGAFYCRRGVVLGESRQAADAYYLLHTLIAGPGLRPSHVIYYGLLAGDNVRAECAPGGGDDSELFAPDDRPRAAAAVLLGEAGASVGRSLLFGPGPGAGENPVPDPWALA